MKNMELQIVKLLSYSAVFPDRHDKIEDLLADVPSNSAIEFISYTLAQKANQFIDDHDVSIWAPWVLNTRNEVKNPIGRYAGQYNLGQYALLDKYAMLLLISHLLTYYNGRNEELTIDDRSNLLLAFMLCCDERIKLNKNLSYNSMSADEFVRNFMPGYLKSHDIDVPCDYRLLLIKCYMLMIEFPKKNKQFAKYIYEFCNEKGLQNAKNYLNELFITYLNMVSTNL